MSEAIRLPPMPARCELCRRASPLTRHHLIPRSLHDKTYVQKRFDREERITATLWVCRPCHNTIHRLFEEKQLALTFNTREALMSDERLRTFVDWLSRKPDGFVPKR
jgi:formate-dependent nitrite reductase cytochrome c552 subunit